MFRVPLRLVLAALCVAAGWVAGTLSTAAQRLELVAYTVEDETTIRCVKGCGRSWGEGGVRDGGAGVPTATFGCPRAVFVRESPRPAEGAVTIRSAAALQRLRRACDQPIR